MGRSATARDSASVSWICNAHADQGVDDVRTEAGSWRDRHRQRKRSNYSGVRTWRMRLKCATRFARLIVSDGNHRDVGNLFALDVSSSDRVPCLRQRVSGTHNIFICR